MLQTLIFIVLILMLIGFLPLWPHSAAWGYGPGGVVGVLLIVLLIMALSGRL
jgi:hypothetical protein